MSHFGAIGHHLIVAIIDHIPIGWVMFNGDMTNDPCKILCQSESRPRAARPWKEASGHSGPLYKSLKLMAIGRRMCNNIESPKRQMSSLECGYQHIDSHANKSLWPLETRVFSSFAQI